MGHYTSEILKNAQKVNLLKSRIDETVKYRDKNDHKFKEWQSACKAFHDQYDSLAFPGGAASAFERIEKGNSQAIEAGLCFIECRPYFFRSGYMYKDLMRKLKKAPMEPSQKARFNLVHEKYIKYREQRNA